MTNKTTTALIAAMTLAFTAPAFAGETPPADSVVQPEATVTTDAALEAESPALGTESAIEVETTVETETDSSSLYQATPANIESEVAGEVLTNEDVYAPTLGDTDIVNDVAIEAEGKMDIESSLGEVPAMEEASDDIKIPQAPELPE